MEFSDQNSTDVAVDPPKYEGFSSLMAEKENHVLGQRWVATFIDFAVLISFLMVPDYVLGNEIYQETIGIWLTLLILYFPISESFTGYSLGKFICRVRVVNDAGSRPSIIQSCIRTMFRLLEVNPFIFGGIPAGLAVLFSKKGQRIGDVAAETYVASSNLVKKYNKARNEMYCSVEPLIR